MMELYKALVPSANISTCSLCLPEQENARKQTGQQGDEDIRTTTVIVFENADCRGVDDDHRRRGIVRRWGIVRGCVECDQVPFKTEILSWLVL